MSCSRWGHSVWYTYWDAGKSQPGIRDWQVFTVNVECHFTYRELKDDILMCLSQARHGATESQLLELRGYMEDFINAVENDSTLK